MCKTKHYLYTPTKGKDTTFASLFRGSKKFLIEVFIIIRDTRFHYHDHIALPNILQKGFRAAVCFTTIKGKSKSYLSGNFQS